MCKQPDVILIAMVSTSFMQDLAVRRLTEAAYLKYKIL